MSLKSRDSVSRRRSPSLKVCSFRLAEKSLRSELSLRMTKSLWSAFLRLDDLSAHDTLSAKPNSEERTAHFRHSFRLSADFNKENAPVNVSLS